MMHMNLKDLGAPIVSIDTEWLADNCSNSYNTDSYNSKKYNILKSGLLIRPQHSETETETKHAL